jgi:exodeoxyribonuclease VII large subunit
MTTLPLPFSADTWTVSDLNRYVRQSLEADDRLQEVRVRGEISGFRAYPSGHWYFSLKDSGAQINCVMWRARAAQQQQRYLPREGDAVEIQGSVTLYETRGQYQLDAAAIQPQGEGRLYREFMQLKARLEAEGLFAAERKRTLPLRPRRIGLVTSAAGAALRDILNILRRRYPLAQVILAPTPVQGADAPPQIVAALQALAALPAPSPEVVIVARGGGSLEDLWAFNDETVARAIAAMPMPVVSGVGHETDFTIADFVADVRAPTPSAAAELATAVTRDQLRDEVDTLTAQAAAALEGRVAGLRVELDQRRAHLNALSPTARFALSRLRVRELQQRARSALAHRLELGRERVERLTQALSAISPLAVLGRGYAIVRRPDGDVIRRTRDVMTGEPLSVRVSDGEFDVRVERAGQEKTG